jgi:hypothetical protein
LAFPNGTCSTNGVVTITNGTQVGHIDVQGADAIPSDSGTHWTLCGGTGASCTGTGGAKPGQDQFEQGTTNATATPTPVPMTTSPACDIEFDGTAGDCVAGSGQSQSEDLFLVGPSASTDTSASFTTTVTWTAVP